MKERREKALQNAKDRNAEKANAQAALQAHTRASKVSKDNQDIKITDDAATQEDSMADVHLPPHPHGKAKYPSQIKTLSKYRTLCTEPLLGNPLPSSQATMKVHGHKPDSGDIGIYKFLIEGAPNSHEAVELLEQALDKKALVWFQEHKYKFVDLTTLKTMFLQRYNPWGKTKRDQLQSWNILTFDPQKTDIDEHIDLINTLGDI